jgi:RNA polymerase sigma-70 factor (ECF subfamily)
MTDGDDRHGQLRVIPGGAPAGDDSALVAAILVGDDEAFAELVRRNEGLLLRILRRWARTPEDARDLAQKAFLKAFEAARRGVALGRREGFPFRRWLVRIALNLAKNHLRDETRWTRAPLEDSDHADAAPAADAALARAEAERSVRRAVARLPRREREVLTLRIDAELPFGEIALALGTTEGSARVSFHHATRRLRAVMEKEEKP